VRYLEAVVTVAGPLDVEVKCPGGAEGCQVAVDLEATDLVVAGGQGVVLELIDPASAVEVAAVHQQVPPPSSHR
jgi:hypothetical protein